MTCFAHLAFLLLHAAHSFSQPSISSRTATIQNLADRAANIWLVSAVWLPTS